LTFRFILPAHPSALSDAACCAFHENNVNRGAINQIRALASSSARTSDDAKKRPKKNDRERERERERERDLGFALFEENQAAPGEGYTPRGRARNFEAGILRRKSRARIAAAAFRGGRSNSSQIEAIPRKPETNFKRIASRSRPRSVVAPRVAVPTSYRSQGAPKVSRKTLRSKVRGSARSISKRTFSARCRLAFPRLSSTLNPQSSSTNPVDESRPIIIREYYPLPLPGSLPDNYRRPRPVRGLRGKAARWSR